MTLSAIVRASAKRRSISCCEGATSWCEYSTEMPMLSSIWMAARRKSCALSSGVMSKYVPVSRGSGAVEDLKRKNSISGWT